jgi:hypothetical protein
MGFGEFPDLDDDDELLNEILKSEKATKKAAEKAPIQAPEPIVTKEAPVQAPDPTITREADNMAASTSNTNTTTTTTVEEPQKQGAMAALGTWTKRAASAGVEGAKDGAAFAAAEVLTMTLISGLSVEFPFLLLAYRSSAIAQKIMQIGVPYLIGAAATMNLLPGNPETIISLCERALRASISANVGPIMRRLEGPIMEAISQAGRQVRASDPGSGESWK